MQRNNLDATELTKFLRQRLHPVATGRPHRISLGLPALASGRKFAPHLSYGRHRGGPPSDCRMAAVALLLYRDPHDGWSLTLTRRPTSLSHHGGQICLPGGRIEAGETPRVACLREYQEELGVEPSIRSVAGTLDSQLVYASRNLVVPVVFVGDPPSKQWKPDSVEVDQVIALPMASWMEAPHRVHRTVRKTVRNEAGEETSELNYQTAGVELELRTLRSSSGLPSGTQQTLEKQFIWGATAIILEQLAQVLRS